MAQIKTKFITDNAVTNAKLAQIPALTLKGNSTGSTANVSDLSVSAVQSLLSIPTSSTPLSLAAGGTGVSAASANAAFDALSPMSTAGDIIFEDATPTAAALAIGTTGQVLTVVGGLPAWAAPATSGTVTSVAMTVPAFLSISGSPITSSGTLAVTLSGTALPILNGGTGATTAAAAFNNLNPMSTTGDLIYESATGVASRLPIGSSGQVLEVVAGIPAWTSLATASTATEQDITLISGDITNQYVDLAHPAVGSSASINSVQLSVVGSPIQHKTVDYTVSLTGGSGGVTRITFAGDLATGGNAALVAGDILMVYYSF